MKTRPNMRTMQMQDTIDRQRQAILLMIAAAAHDRQSIERFRDVLASAGLTGVTLCDRVLSSPTPPRPTESEARQ